MLRFVTELPCYERPELRRIAAVPLSARLARRGRTLVRIEGAFGPGSFITGSISVSDVPESANRSEQESAALQALSSSPLTDSNLECQRSAKGGLWARRRLGPR